MITNFMTALVTSKQTLKREQKKNDSDLKLKIAEYAIENPEKLLQIEKQLAIGVLMVDNINMRIRRYIIPNHRIQIGRYITCDIILNNPYISNEHCAISSNGTKVNGKFIDSKIELKDGDLIEIEDRKIEYKKLSN